MGNVAPFLHDNTDVAPKSREKLLCLVHTQSDMFLIELAVNNDVGEPFVKATYTLEGARDGPLALKRYDVTDGVKAALRVCHRPNTVAIAKRIARQQQSEQSWIQYGSNCVKPGLDFSTAKLDGDL